MLSKANQQCVALTLAKINTLLFYVRENKKRLTIIQIVKPFLYLCKLVYKYPYHITIQHDDVNKAYYTQIFGKASHLLDKYNIHNKFSNHYQFEVVTRLWLHCYIQTLNARNLIHLIMRVYVLILNGLKKSKHRAKNHLNLIQQTKANKQAIKKSQYSWNSIIKDK